MAKKLRKMRRPLWVVFIQLLIPWVAMGAVAVVASAAGAPTYLVFVLAMAGALAVTWAVYWFSKPRRVRAQ